MSDEQRPLDSVPPGWRVTEEWELAPRRVRAMLEERPDEVVLVDCREDKELEQARVEGALHVPMSELRARMDDLEDHEDKTIVVMCHLGKRSMTLTALLREQGFGDVWSMAGGIDLWAVDVDPGVGRY